MLFANATRFTCPFVTLNAVELNDATPLFVSDASSPATVIDVPVCVTSIPSPPRIDRLCPDGVKAPESVVTVLTTVSSSSTCPVV